MKEATVTFHIPHQLEVKGSIHFNNVVHIFESGLPYLNGVTILEVDFSQAQAEDSAILTLLTSWLRVANTLNVQLRYCHLNTRVQDLLRVCGLENIIRPYAY